jgi:serine/threonine-protein kinase
MGDPENSERYQPDEEVGKGALATVWRGRMNGGEGFSRRVAIKALRGDLGADVAFVTAFAKCASRLMEGPRPNVEGVLDVVRHGSDCFVVTDWVDGPSLKSWVEAHHARNEPAPWGQLLAIGADVLFGLHQLHTRAQPLVHGGIGSTSIRLDRAGIATLTRFGVRMALDAVNADAVRARADRLRVDAPEGQLTASADVFCVGVLLYTVLAGATEFGDLPEDLQKRLMGGKPVDLNLIRQDIPAVVLRTIERALRTDPRERFDSAVAMARSLQLVLRSIAEITDPQALAHSIENVLPRGRAAAKPAEQQKAPSNKATPAQPTKKLGLSAEATDQLDLNDLRKLKIDED